MTYLQAIIMALVEGITEFLPISSTGHLVLAATGLDLFKSNFAFTSYEYSLLAVGFVASFLVAIAAVKFFLRFIQSHTFIPFGIYRIIVALLFWIILRA